MPNNTRQWAHRKIDMANGNLKTAGCHLLEIAEVYQNNHPEIADQYKMINITLVEISDILDKIKRSF